MADISEEEMLAELRAISNKSSNSRFAGIEKKVVSTKMYNAPDGGSKENSEVGGVAGNVGSNGDAFLLGNPEDTDLNQYWYSKNTIEALTNECESLIKKNGKTFKIAFLSTPSIYFALSDESRKQCYVFDYDKKWDNDRGFVFYDFNEPLEFDKELLKIFDLIVIDPPFITRAVWEQYTVSAKALLKSSPTYNNNTGRIIGTTVQENAPFMEELLACKAQKFKPSIPNLVYQYNSYANFEDVDFLGKVNPEILED